MNGPTRTTPAPLLAAVGLLLLAAAACSGARPATGPDRAELLSERTAPSGRSCRVSTLPAELPQPGDLVEEAAVIADVRQLVGTRAEPERYVLLSMVYDRFGANIRRAVIEHNVSGTVADSVQKLVFAHRRTLDEQPRELGVRLRVDLDEPIRLQVGRQEFCDPAPRDADLAYAIQHTHGAGHRMRGRVRENLVWVRLTVGPRGTVLNAELERGALSNTALLQSILDYVRGYFFYPALEDGFPATGTISVPIRVREG